MSTASRDCGSAGGTCGGVRNAHSAPGVRAKPRGYYDPRAARQLGGPIRTEPKCWPQDDNAAPPLKKRAHRRIKHWWEDLPCRPCASLELMPYFSIGLREPRLRHSPPLLLPRPPPEAGFAFPIFVIPGLVPGTHGATGLALQFAAPWGAGLNPAMTDGGPLSNGQFQSHISSSFSPGPRCLTYSCCNAKHRANHD